MNEEELKTRLLDDESTDLEWKRQLPIGLDGKRADLKSFEKAKAEFVKDIASMANVRKDGCGYIIYGFEDKGGRREAIEDTSTFNFDDASIRQMLEPYLEPSPEFECYQVKTNQHIARIIKIYRVPAFPHVIKKSLGGIIYEGQVYYRLGTYTKIATHSELRSMFFDHEPIKLATHDGKEIEKIRKHYADLGRKCSLSSIGAEHEKLREGFELAYSPGTRRKVLAGYNQASYQYDHILMLEPKSYTS